jgi:hypothetical protein
VIAALLVATALVAPVPADLFPVDAMPPGPDAVPADLSAIDLPWASAPRPTLEKPKPKAKARPRPRPTTRTVSAGSVWDRLAQCESGGNWSLNVGAFDGGLQFAPSTWTAMGGDEFAQYAWQATRAEQIVVAERTLAAAGWGAWPGCARKLGLR